jgi:EAL domain-containing protein (putative c-di-GMP-specific phosphodiesterase class I)
LGTRFSCRWPIACWQGSPRNTGGDHICRLSADTFLVLLEGLQRREDCLDEVQRFLTDFRSEPFQVGGVDVYLGARAGIHFGKDTPDALVESLLRGTDLAHQRARTSGRDLELFDRSMDIVVRDRLELESRLRQALQNNALVPWFQPRVDARTGKILGAESLARWIPPGETPISPGRFIPVAEESGLIAHLGMQILEKSCAQIAHWREGGWTDLVISVNVSPIQLADRGFPDEVEKLLTRYRIPANNLELEVTESAFLDHPREAAQALERLRSKGIAIALDDFGTGYSSLSQLRSLPIDTLKVDRQFVIELATRPDAAVVLRALFQMAEGLRLDTVAEGVEELEQLDFLREVGCHQIQGFLFSQAVPPERFEELLARPTLLPQPVARTAV